MKFLTGDDTGLIKVVHVEKQKVRELHVEALKARCSCLGI